MIRETHIKLYLSRPYLRRLQAGILLLLVLTSCLEGSPTLKKDLSPQSLLSTKAAPVIPADIFNDPFINISNYFQRECTTLQDQHYSFNGRKGTIEYTFMVPLQPTEVLPYFEKEFEANKLAHSIYHVGNQNTYIFNGKIGNQNKNAMLILDSQNKGTIVKMSSEISNISLQKKYIHLPERYSEFHNLPGKTVQYQEDHYNKMVNACIKLQFNGGIEYALNEVERWLVGSGWTKSKYAEISPAHCYTKHKASIQAIPHTIRDTYVVLYIKDFGN